MLTLFALSLDNNDRWRCFPLFRWTFFSRVVHSPCYSMMHVMTDDAFYPRNSFHFALSPSSNITRMYYSTEPWQTINCWTRNEIEKKKMRKKESERESERVNDSRCIIYILCKLLSLAFHIFVYSLVKRQHVFISFSLSFFLSVSSSFSSHTGCSLANNKLQVKLLLFYSERKKERDTQTLAWGGWIAFQLTLNDLFFVRSTFCSRWLFFSSLTLLMRRRNTLTTESERNIVINRKGAFYHVYLSTCM